MRLAAVLIAGCAWLASAHAGSFGVSPIRVDLDARAKSALVTVTNDDERQLGFQVRALEWTQDAAGADRYAPTSELVYFPQQLRIPPKESRVIRIGYKVPARHSEKAYRLFVEELAERGAPSASRTGVAITLRFGVPVFLRPAAERLAGELALEVADGAARALVRNQGSVHFRIGSVRYAGIGASGETLFEHSLDGWYVLAGAQRPFPLKLPADACRNARLLRVEAVVDNLDLRAERALEAHDCR